MSPSSAIRPDSFQRAHNYHHLIARWRRVARAAGVPLRPLAKAGTYTVYFLDYRPADVSADRGGLYATAGVHGDEAGTTEGLLLWAERHLPALTKPGLVRRRQRTALAKFDSRPEAIWLYLNRTRHSLTIETPSKFSLAARARMQAQLIEICVERLFITRRRRCCR